MRRVRTTRRPMLACLVIAGTAITGRAGEPVTLVEEVVTTTSPADNGAGPLWCYGSPLIAREGDRVFVSVIETGEGVPPLSNTRWRLSRRDRDGWKQVAIEGDYREREPCPLVIPSADRLVLSVNPSTQPRGTKYGSCDPHLLLFSATGSEMAGEPIRPRWEGTPRFTDHSYRGLAADGRGGEVLLLNIDAVTSEQNWCLLNRDLETTRAGKIGFPIRACYPQVGLRDREGHVLAIGDIVEPNEAWRDHKKEKTGSAWDYVFRRLFYAWSPDLSREGFQEPIEVDTVESTGGHIQNLDLWIDDDGAAHLLYLKTNVTPVLRERFFEGEKIETTLEEVVMSKGRVVTRRTIHEGGEGRDESVTYARFHSDGSGPVWVVAAVSGRDEQGTPVFENRILRLTDEATIRTAARLDLQEPFRVFFTACERGGSGASKTLDLFGVGADGSTLRYARIELP